MSRGVLMETSTHQSLPPLPLALVVCDVAHRDAGNGKWTLLGLFSVIATRDLPFTHPLFWVYFAFTDANGRVPLKIRLVDANEDRPPLIEMSAELELDNPLAVHEVVAPILGVTFQEFGEYRLQAFTCGDLLIERRIMVVDSSKEKADDQI
jgi:hypothetical protein